jgi:toxin FitB
MLILDTNIVAALMREPRVDAVVKFLDNSHPADLYTTAITTFEIRQGIRALPEGIRSRALDLAFGAFVSNIIEGRVLPFDDSAADAAADLIARRRRAGIALTCQATIITRNIKDFDDCGLELVNPWAVS